MNHEIHRAHRTSPHHLTLPRPTPHHLTTSHLPPSTRPFPSASSTMGNKLAKAKKAGAADASGTPAAGAATAEADVAETAEGLESMDLSGFSQGGADEASKLNVDDFELIKVLGKGISPYRVPRRTTSPPPTSHLPSKC